MQNANKLPNGPPTCLWLCTPSRQLSKLQLPIQPAVRFFRRGKRIIATAVKAHPNFCSSARLEYAIPWWNKNHQKPYHKDFSGQDSFHAFHGSFHGPRFQTAMLLVLLQTWRIPNCDWSHTWRPQIQKKTQQPMKKKQKYRTCKRRWLLWTSKKSSAQWRFTKRELLEGQTLQGKRKFILGSVELQSIST